METPTIRLNSDVALVVQQHVGDNVVITRLEGGRLHGECAVFREGVMIRSKMYKCGKKDGLSSKWSTKGVPIKITSFKEGRKRGLFSGFHSNGKLSVQATLTQGSAGKKSYTIDGATMKFYTNGAISHQITYKNGKKDGVASEWYSDGAVKSHETYKEGVIYDRAYKFARDGKIISDSTYDNNGKLVDVNDVPKWVFHNDV